MFVKDHTIYVEDTDFNFDLSITYERWFNVRFQEIEGKRAANIWHVVHTAGPHLANWLRIDDVENSTIEEVMTLCSVNTPESIIAGVYFLWDSLPVDNRPNIEKSLTLYFEKYGVRKLSDTSPDGDVFDFINRSSSYIDQSIIRDRLEYWVFEGVQKMLSKRVRHAFAASFGKYLIMSMDVWAVMQHKWRPISGVKGTSSLDGGGFAYVEGREYFINVSSARKIAEEMGFEIIPSTRSTQFLDLLKAFKESLGCSVTTVDMLRSMAIQRKLGDLKDYAYRNSAMCPQIIK